MKRAFSLLELLVVIGVIAILTGLALPALRGARDRARTTVCLAQARQLVTSVAAFTTANQGKLPENRTLVAPTQHLTWRAALRRDGYVPQDASWACPAHVGGPGSERGMIDNGTECVDDVASSYALNGHLIWRETKRRTTADRTEAAVGRPSHTVLLPETNAPFPDIRVTPMLVATEGDNGVGVYGYWHAKQGVYGFLDGHAETIAMMATGNPDCRWHNGRDYQEDPVNPQPAEEVGQHAHPDWQYLLPSVYQTSGW